VRLFGRSIGDAAASEKPGALRSVEGMDRVPVIVRFNETRHQIRLAKYA
jgi:hypothetical protein